jgi:hypothetical protein
LLEYLPHVYGAALAAARDQEAACTVTECVFQGPVAGADRPCKDPRCLVEQVICLAVRTAPGHPFGVIAPQDREAVALARLAGYSVEEIAMTLELSPAETKRRLRAGLEAIALERQALAS